METILFKYIFAILICVVGNCYAGSKTRTQWLCELPVNNKLYLSENSWINYDRDKFNIYTSTDINLNRLVLGANNFSYLSNSGWEMWDTTLQKYFQKIPLTTIHVKTVQDLINLNYTSTFDGQNIYLPPGKEIAIDETIYCPYSIIISSVGSTSIYSINAKALVYIGTGTFFKGTSTPGNFFGIIPKGFIYAPYGTMFGIDGISGGGTVVLQFALLNCKYLGYIKGARISIFNGQLYASDGTFLWENCSSAGAVLTSFIASGANVTNYITITGALNYSYINDNVFSLFNSTQSAINISSSTTISTMFRVQNNTILNSSKMYATSSLDEKSLNVYAHGNYPILDSHIYGLIYSTSNALVTSGSATPQIASVTWTTDGLQRVDSPQNGRIRYIGTETINLRISASFMIKADNASARTYRIMIYKNGEPILYGFSDITTAGTSAMQVPIETFSNTKTNDYYEVYIYLLSGTGNLTIQSGIFGLRE